MSIKKLDGNNFLSQVTKYGFFAEQFPECYTSSMFSDNIYDLLPLAPATKSQTTRSRKNTTSPSTLSTYKNDISRRILSVPNPEAFLRLANYIKLHWDEIKTFAKSSNSLSPITFIRSYDHYDAEELINCEAIRECLKTKSHFISGIKDCIRISLGYKYRLKVDITNCYNSMYTHSISWAICGKAQSKEYMRTNLPESLKNNYELADALDTFIRFQKNNETNGIIVGPYTSRIISEIILARIDKELAAKELKFKRYVDDYKMYFRTEAQAQECLPIIEKVLNEYNLSLNTAKTEITKYPYEIISDLKGTIEKAFDVGGVFGVLNTAGEKFSSGEKGAYKYALKYIKDKPIPVDELDTIIPTLINIMLIDPRYGKYVTQYLKENLRFIKMNTLIQVCNKELSGSLNNQLQQESLLFIQIIRELGLKITGENMLKILASDNDFAIIIALDLWKNKKKYVLRSSAEARKINNAIKELMKNLEGEKISGSRWLLLYQIKVNELVAEKMLPATEWNDFFKKMLSLKISFYNAL